jgi:PAS domain S-box-containing protein
MPKADDKEPLRSSVTSQDNAERQRADEALRASEVRFRTLFEDTPGIAVQGYDAGRRVIFWNRASERLYGYARDEALGRQLEDLIIPEEMREAVVAAVNGWIAGGPPIPAAELVLRHKDGSAVQVFSTHAMQQGPDGPEMYCIDLDVAAQKRTEAELKRHRQHLEELVIERTLDLVEAKVAAEAASRAKSLFLANMSHELRTPMNGVMGLIDLAKGRMADASGRDLLDKAKRSAERLLGVLNDILDISKIEAGSLKLENVPLQLGASVDGIVGVLAHQAAHKGLSLRVELPAELAGLALEGDPLRLGQVLMNLLGNAIKFTERGTIMLRVRQIGDAAETLRVRFEVIDTGIGIGAQAQSRLFTSFEQADNSMTRRYGGTGLGLAICKRLVHMMGGEIGMHSAPGEGSTFWFVVPLKRLESGGLMSAPTKAPIIAEQRLRAEFPGARVLLAEDDPIAQIVSGGLLEDVGLVFDLAGDGQQALDLARQNAYALILMDMQMPVVNGVEAARAIRADSLNRDTPILAMTANAFDEDRQACLDAGMNDHIAKPIDSESMYATLLAWLDRRGDRSTA